MTHVTTLNNCLATAHIIYRLPDFPSLLEEFLWQQADIAPDLPHLKRFLEFWDRTIEGKIHSVKTVWRPLYTGNIVAPHSVLRLH